MRVFYCAFLMLIFLESSFGQSALQWPKSIVSDDYTVRIYQPVVESLNGNVLKTRGAFSIISAGKEDPVFGAVWASSILQTDRNKRTAVLDKITIEEIRFAGDTNANDVARLKAFMEKEIPQWNMVLSLDQLEASMAANGENNSAENNTLSTAPPKIIYTNRPSTLVLIEGEPKLKENKDLGVELVINTPFTIGKVNGMFYLNGSGKWYSSKDIYGPWKYIKSIPASLNKLDKAIQEADKKDVSITDSAAAVIPEILVSTVPTELIQSNGEADFAPVKGTNLLYMTNTNNDVFMNVPDQKYYVLLSGRWYQSASLKGPWTYSPPDQLPADFAKIPEGSPKDDVLASVAGTEQARDAVMDAQIPQTAKVDRKTATAKVNYDGDPKFLAIEGTNLQYAINTSSTVLLSDKTYYCVENGIWFEAISPKGPWTVSTTRPADVNKIPASTPVYNVKYVYIYETTPQYVYVGYTPGYMGCYVFGPTVVYGTGFYYNPWYGPYFYPRPVTYGFGMRYNPFYGWSVGFHYSTGWFNFSIYGGGYHGGYWWGPPVYRPPYYHRPGYPPYYRPPYYPRPGYRPPVATPYYRGANYNINNNIYRNNRGVQTNDVVRPMPAQRPSAMPSVRPSGANQTSTNPVNPGNRMPSAQPANRPTTFPSSQQTTPNNFLTDRQGNVFQKDGNSWQQRSNSGWQNVNQNRQSEINTLNRQMQSFNRGNIQTNNFNQSRQGASQRPSPQPSSAPVRGRR